MSAQSAPKITRDRKDKRRMAAYIEDLVEEMERIAKREGIEPLSDLLRLAKEEARRASRFSGEGSRR